VNIFRLPDIGEGLNEAEIIEWLVKPGDEVHRDQPIVEVMTDKASSELSAPVSGVIISLGGTQGDRLRVGEMLAEIDESSETKTTSEPSPPDLEKPPTPTSPKIIPNNIRPKASPLIRRKARELGLDLNQIAGTGPGQRIVSVDLEAASNIAHDSTPPQIPEVLDETIDSAHENLGQMSAGSHPLVGIRRQIALNTTQSWTQIPHIHSFDELDGSLILDLQTRFAAMGRKLTILALATVATCRALSRFPLVNSYVADDSEQDSNDWLVVQDRINLGIAVATTKGLIVPVLQNADQLDLFSAAKEIAEIVTRARNGDLDSTHLRGATFTITNYGSLGGRWATPIIPPGQSAILGLGRIEKRPAVHEDIVVPRPMLPVVVGADHRIIDGDLLEAFKNSIFEDLKDPLRLLIK